MTKLTTSNAINQSLLNTIFNLGEKSGRAFIVLNKFLHIVYQSESHHALSGFPFNKVKDQHFSSIIGNQKSQQHISNLEKKMLSGELYEMSIVHQKFQDGSFTAQLDCYPFQNEQQETTFVLILVKDVTEEKIHHSLIRLEQNILQTIDTGLRFEEKLEQICYEINYIFNPHCFTTIAWFNQEKIYLYADSTKEGQFVQTLSIHDEHYQVYNNFIQADSSTMLNSLSNISLDPTHKAFAKANNFDRAITIPFKLSNGEKKGAIILYFDDVTRNTRPFHHFFKKLSSLVEFAYNYERQKNEMYNLAYYDGTLEIPNRYGMLHFIEQRTQELQHKKLSVILLSPSEYIKIVELYGRDAGDLVLKGCVQRITECKDYDIEMIGRFSSSTLYVIVAGEIDYTMLTHLLDYKMAQPTYLNGRTIYMTVKAGIATQQPNEKIEETCRHAEIALSQARKFSGNRLGIYEEQYTLEIEKELILLNHLTEAIQNKEIQVFFQPKVELHRGRVDSMEALARWISPTLGFISPAEFIPVAEKNGLIRKIDELMIEQVLIWMQQRLYNGQKIVPVSVNISAEHFYHPNFIENLTSLVKAYYADPKYLIIEITETLGLEDIDRAHNIINRLNLHGFIVSVDDFGIGYSSLSYLQKLNFRELKIDMSFVKRLDEVGTYAIVRSIIDIAKNLEMRIIAEGVETEEQAKLLKQLGCDVVQGYLYYKPMPAHAVDL